MLDVGIFRTLGQSWYIYGGVSYYSTSCHNFPSFWCAIHGKNYAKCESSASRQRCIALIGDFTTVLDVLVCGVFVVDWRCLTIPVACMSRLNCRPHEIHPPMNVSAMKQTSPFRQRSRYGGIRTVFRKHLSSVVSRLHCNTTAGPPITMQAVWKRGEGGGKGPLHT